jgi:anti-sigma factor RsiW
MNDCTLYDIQLTAYAAGELTEPDLGAVESHLARCADCRAELAREKELRDLLGGLPTAECPDTVTHFLNGVGQLDEDISSERRFGWWPAGLGMIAAALLAVLLIPGLLDNADQTDGLVAQANSDAHEFTAAEISQARRDVIATLALAADVLERSRENTVVDVFGARLPRVINGSLRSPISDAHGTTDNHKTAPTGGNG